MEPIYGFSSWSQWDGHTISRPRASRGRPTSQEARGISRKSTGSRPGTVRGLRVKKNKTGDPLCRDSRHRRSTRNRRWWFWLGHSGLSPSTQEHLGSCGVNLLHGWSVRTTWLLFSCSYQSDVGRLSTPTRSKVKNRVYQVGNNKPNKYV